MQLYITPLSPYAHMVRIVALEKGLANRVEVIAAKTRVVDSPYYAINPSGRVPYLIRDDGVGVEDSAVICAYLDELDGAPAFAWPPGERGFELRRLEASARSMLDGLTVWGRELRHRPEHERSPAILEHERQRSRRMADLWEKQIEHPLMGSGFHLPQITLACALRYQSRVLGSQWRVGRPRLAGWMDEIALRPSLAATEAQTQDMLVQAEASR
jgi:glutathione S-transferase